MNTNDFRCMRHGVVMQTLTTDDMHNMQPYIYQNTKHNKAILLLHGFGSSPAVFRQLIPTLKLLYDKIVIPLLPGHGSNLSDFATSTATQWQLETEQHCADLCQEFSNVDLMGLSLGGVLALNLSMKYAINHLYLLAPALNLQINLQYMLILAKFLKFFGFQYINNNAGTISKLDSYEIAYYKLPLTTIIEIFTFLKQLQYLIPNCPIELFLGKHDLVINNKKILDRFHSFNNVNLHWLLHSEHILPLDNDLQLIITALQQNNTTCHISGSFL